MRRLVSIFARRSDRSDAEGSVDGSQVSQNKAPSRPNKKNSRLLNVTSHITVSTEPVRSSTYNQVHSSASSSTGSASLQTPEDEGHFTSRDAPKKALVSWLSRKQGTQDWEGRTRSVPILHQPPPPRSGNHQQRAADSEEDSASDSSHEPDLSAAAIDRTTLKVSSSALNQSRAKLLSVLSNSLLPPFSPPPCLNLPSGPLFPRSSNSPGCLQFKETTESYMHRAALLRRLKSSTLCRAEERSIIPFASKPLPSMNPKHTSLSEAAVASTRVQRFSEGLRRWTCRSCFEDRVVVWEPTQNGKGQPDVSWRKVSGNDRGLGVEALEISRGLEVLAGLVPDEEVSEVSASPTSAPGSQKELPPSSASSSSSNTSGSTSRNTAPLPSPLRMQQSSSSPLHLSFPRLSSPWSPASPVSPSTPSSLQVPLTSQSKKPNLLSVPPVPSVSLPIPLPSPHVPSPSHDQKPSVRSAQSANNELSPEDAADRIPLGYAVRIKKQREEKARFLQEERERRLLEEKRNQEEERRKHEAEKREWEKEKKAWEKEKKAMEEERKQKLYEEVVATRRRREEQRSGSRASRIEGDREESRSRRAQDSPRHGTTRQVSEPQVPTRGSVMLSPPVVSERPHSVSGSYDRPPSMYSSHGASVEDVRLKDRGRKSRRSVTDPSSPSTPPSTWGHSHGPVPPMPSPYGVPVMDNTPLLPPTAPFMMQGYGGNDRSRSRSGSNSRRDSSLSSGSSSRSRPQSGVSANHSTDRVDSVHGHRPPSSSQKSTARKSSAHGHERRSSGGDAHNRLSVPTTLGSTGRSYSDVERRHSSLRGTEQPPQPSRPAMVGSVSWGGPWVAHPAMTSMPMYSPAPAFYATPVPMVPMLSPMVPHGQTPTNQRQSFIF